MIELKYAEARSYAAPETAALRIMEIANTIEPAQGKIYIELINYPMFVQGQGLSGRILDRATARDRKRLVKTARKWNLRNVHAGRGGPVRIGDKRDGRP